MNIWGILTQSITEYNKKLLKNKTIFLIKPLIKLISTDLKYISQPKMVSRLQESIKELKSQSAWSPMPEHLMFIHLDKEKSPTPNLIDGEKICEDCGMKFISEAMLTYHKVGFCFGPSTDELLLDEIPTDSSFVLPDEAKSLPSNKTDEVQHSSKNTALPVSNEIKAIKQEPPKLEWCMCAHGAVAPASVKVGYDDSDQTYTYLCVAQVGEEVIPGTVLPPRKHATVLYRGNEIKATDYSVLTDLRGLTIWKPCETKGGVPRDAVRGGYDSNELQYFIARGKAPDGNWFCGQYIPHKQQCFFAWEGNEYKTNNFEVLCKTTAKKYFNSVQTNTKQSVDTMKAKHTEATVILPSDASQDINLTQSVTQLVLDTDRINNINELEDKSAVIETGKIININNSAGKTQRQDTGTINLQSPRQINTPKMVKSGTEVKTQGMYGPASPKDSITKESRKFIKPREPTKSGVSSKKDFPKESSKIVKTRELTKTNALDKQSVSKETSKIMNKRELTRPGVSKEMISKENSKLTSRRQNSTPGYSQEFVSKEKSKIDNKMEFTMSSVSMISKENSKLTSRRQNSTPGYSQEFVSKEKSKIDNKKEFTMSSVSKEHQPKEKSTLAPQRELTSTVSNAQSSNFK